MKLSVDLKLRACDRGPVWTLHSYTGSGMDGTKEEGQDQVQDREKVTQLQGSRGPPTTHRLRSRERRDGPRRRG